MTLGKILVVDDDVGLQYLMRLGLQRAGYEFIMATTGEEGVRKVRTEKPDLVLMDVIMPGMGGFEACECIRQLPEGRHIPIIFFSALSELDGEARGQDRGKDEYITKPVKMRDLLARIEHHLRREAPALGHVGRVVEAKARLLVINDNTVLAELISTVLKRQGYKVDTVFSSAEGLRKARELKPDLVIMDVSMSVMDGYEVCRRLRSDPDTAHLAVLMLTTRKEPKRQLRDFGPGAVVFLTMPIKMKELLQRVKSLLRAGGDSAV